MNPYIRLHPADDVVIARSQLLGGTVVEDVKVHGPVSYTHLTLPTSDLV